ncbi:ATP-binding cassette domain-containing protein [Fodinibacter luteus]|uniref:ATP-binding cassette domain-containing protein n=1 Tax=Fodinibacter luteus TaxID=552064 RepID=A0ABP8KID0_9MICO
MPEHAISLSRVSVALPGSDRPVLRDVDLVVEEGELALVVGRTGSGKSTLLGAMCGRVPHFTGGTLTGHVRLHGRDTREHRPRELADLVGVVGQDPLAGFVTDTVEEELAYGMEQLGLPAPTMRKRVEETLDLLGIAELRDAALRELSGGQQQRVAIGSVLTAHPRVIVLDEPTSALDPTGAEEVLATITRLVHDLAVTVVVAEHRVERVLHHADTVVHVSPDGAVRSGPPADVMVDSDIASPVVELGRYAGWSPLPLSVRDARRAAGDLRSHLAATLPALAASGPTGRRPIGRSSVSPLGAAASSASAAAAGSLSGADAGAPVALSARAVVVRHPGDVLAVAGVSLDMRAGEVAAVMGRNGSGKSSLLWALQGSGTLTSGAVLARRPRAGEPGRTAGARHPERHHLDPAGGTVEPRTLGAAERRSLVGMVPQSATDLLYLDTVGAECAQADRESGAQPGTCAALLAEVTPGIPADRHPRDLSEGQKLALVLAVQLSADPPVLLLDEPTRGLDPTAKAVLGRVLRGLAARGRAVVVATHDVEFVAESADRVVVMAGGEVVADGPTAEVVVSSPAFAPQVSKVTAPGPWLTVADVREALSGVAS